MYFVKTKFKNCINKKRILLIFVANNCTSLSINAYNIFIVQKKIVQQYALVMR